MRKSTLIIEEKYMKSYEKIISEINKNGKVTICGSNGEPITVNTGRSIRRVDIYSLVAQDVGLGHSEHTVAWRIRKILKEKKQS
jgi:predicted PP-loop superfamily ATPase